jgi:hypothetical protein
MAPRLSGFTPIPSPPVPVAPRVPLAPAAARPVRPSLSAIGPPIKRSTASAVAGSPGIPQLYKDKSRLGVEAKEIGLLIKNAPLGLANLFGGVAVDLGQMFVDTATFGLYDAPLGTDPGSTTVGKLGISFWNSTYGLVEGKRREEYIKAWREGRPISGMIIEDAGNISILGGWMAKAFSAGSKAAAAGAAGAGAKAASAAADAATFSAGFKPGATAAARQASYEAAMRAGVNPAKGSSAAALTQDAARFAAREQRLAGVSKGLGTTAQGLQKIKVAGDKAMLFPLKPYIWGYKGASQIVRTGNLEIAFKDGGSIGTNFRFWGENAAKKYEAQLNDLRTAEPDINATDPRYSELVQKISFHNSISQLQGVRAFVRRAVRTTNHESSLMTGAMLEVKQNPQFKNDINPDTGEVWGELTPNEQQAVIAVLRGHAQTVSELSRIDGMSPGDIADMLKFDYSPEYALTPEGAQLAVEFVNAHYTGATPSHPAVTKAMSVTHYERLSYAVDQILKIMVQLSEKATQGYGRKSPLHAEYLVPTPFVDKLGDALRRSGVKTKSGQSAYELFLMVQESGHFNLPVDSLARQNTLVMFVEMLPDDYALDGSMYPAAMRENIEYYNRYRKGLQRRLIGEGEGNPVPSNELPPVGPDEYIFTRKSGAPGAVESLIYKTEKAINKVVDKIDKVVAKIKVLEKKYKKTAQEIQRYDIIDEFIAGRDPKYLARKYQIPIAKVREILDASPIVKQFNRVKAVEAELAALEKVIGKTRAATPLDQLESVEMQSMQAQYDQLLSEVEATRQRISELQEVNETVRQIEERSVSETAEQLSKLDDELGDAEQELIDVGGDPDQFIVREDITDPTVVPMTPGQTKAFFESVINHIDNEIAPFVADNMPEAAADIQRSKTLLIDTWNRAEKAFFDGDGEWQIHAASMRMIQIGELYRDIEIALTVARSPQTSVQTVLDILTNKDTLDIISGVKKPVGLVLPRTAAATRRETIFEKADISDEYRIDLRKPAVLDALYEDLNDPTVIADLFGASPYGNTALMAEAASQLIRWIKEVSDASPKQKIALILNPPKYVDPLLARKLLSGMTRKLADIPKATVTHPTEVFNRRVLSEAESIISQLKKIEIFYRTYGETPKYVDWKTQAEDFTNRNAKDGHPRNSLRVGLDGSVTIKVIDGIDYESPTVPEISFPANTPAQVVIKGIDSIIKSIEADAGSRIFAGDYNPGFFDGYYVKTIGLTRKLKKYTAQAIADLEFIKTRIEARAKAVGDDFFVSKDSPRLLTVAVKKTGELVGRQQFDSFKDYSVEFAGTVKQIYDFALENDGWEGWTPEELLREANLMAKFSDIFSLHKYEADAVAFDQKIYDFYNGLSREERQIFFDSLSHMRDELTDVPRTKQNVKAISTLDTIIDFLNNGKHKGNKETRLSLIEQAVEDSQAAATGAITTRRLRLNAKSDFVIIPCGNSKLSTAAPASEFYTGSMFQDSLRTARKLFSDDRIYVMSAKHGIVPLDKVLEPYDVKLGMEGSIDARTLADSLDEAGIEGTITSLLPKMYDQLFTEAAAGRFEIDHHFEGSRGIGDQKARLAKLRDSAPETIEAPDIPKNMEGAIELSAELEQTAVFLAESPDTFQIFKEEATGAADLLKALEEVRNPTLQDLTEFKTTFTARMQEEVNTIKGAMEDTLGAKWDRATNKVTFYLTPVKNVPEWEWWFQLDARERRYIALNHFTSTETKTGYGRGGPRYERSAGAVDSLAESVNMTPEEFGDAMVANIRQLRKSQKALAEAKKTKAEDFKEIYVDENLPEVDAADWKFAEDFGMTADDAMAVIDRVNFLTQRDVSPIDTPYALRDIAESPDQVKYDMEIRNVNVRDAAYEVDLIDSMAKEAAKKVRAAKRLSERMEALQEFIDKSKVHNARVASLLKKRKNVENVRLLQAARGEKITELKNLRKDLKKEVRTLRKVISRVEESPDYPRLTGISGSFPLRLALNKNISYPSTNYVVRFPDSTEVKLSGPAYLPTGKAETVAGGIRREVVKEGLDGYKRSTSEHYRDGDRHTIFSITALAKRIESDVKTMSQNEAYKNIVAHFGNKPLEVLGEEKIIELQKRAAEIALSYPIDRLYAGFDEIVREAEAAGEPLTDGIAAYSIGLKDPVLALKYATAQKLGELIVQEMQAKGLRPIDAYKSIDAFMRVSSITDQTMFVPDNLRESIAAMNVVIDPTQWNAIVRGMNSLTSKFKTGTLVLSTSWQLGDLFTNILIATMVGEKLSDTLQQLSNVKRLEYGTGITGLWNMLDPKQQRPLALSPIEYGKVRIAKESPVQDISIQTAQRRSLQGLKPGIEKPTKLNRITKGKVDYPEILAGRSAVKILFKLNETINRLTRHAFFFSKLEKILIEKNTTLDDLAASEGSWRFDPELRQAVEDAAQSANDWLGDFSDLSLFERKYIVGQVPFYAWIKHVHKVFVAMGLEHPQSIAWYIYMGNFMYDPNDDPLGLRYGGANFFGGVASVNTFTPFADVTSGPIGALLTENDLRPALNTLGPVSRLAGGLIAGFDVTKLEKLQRPAGTGQYTETGIASGGGLLPPLPGGSFTQAAGFTLGQFPIAKRALQILPGNNIPGTDIALGPVNTYLTGEARLNPTTRQRVEKWGGTPAAVARLFSIPLVPFKTDQQIREATMAARVRLASVAVLKAMREAQGTP